MRPPPRARPQIHGVIRQLPLLAFLVALTGRSTSTSEGTPAVRTGFGLSTRTLKRHFVSPALAGSPRRPRPTLRQLRPSRTGMIESTLSPKVTYDDLVNPRFERIAQQARRELLEQRRLQRQSIEAFERTRNRLDEEEKDGADDDWESWVSFGSEPAVPVGSGPVRLGDREWRRGDYGLIVGLVRREEMNGLGAVVIKGRNAAGRITAQVIDPDANWREKRRFVELRPENIAPSKRCVRAESMMAWMESLDAFVRGVRIGEASFSLDGKGLVASRDADPGDTLIHLPEVCLLRTLDKTLPPAYMAAILDADNDMLFARQGLRLAFERKLGANSSWMPYLRTLPPYLPDLPILWTEEEVRKLDAESVYTEVIRNNVTLAMASQRVDIDKDILRWGTGIAGTRTIHLKLKGTFFVPLVDMCRHSFSPNAEVEFEDGYLTVVAKKRIKEGEPVLINYGNECNEQFLLSYGFVPQVNPHEVIKVRFNSSQMFAMSRMGSQDERNPGALQAELETFELSEMKLALMSYYNVREGVEVAVADADGVNENFRSALRCLLSDEEVQDVDEYKNPLTSLPHEWVVCHAIRILYAHLLTEHKESEDEDVALLSLRDDKQLTSPEVLAIKFRLAKKRILRKAYAQVTQEVQALSQKMKQE